MTPIEQALDLASRGFHVFPCRPGSKLPCIKDFPNRATRDPEQIAKWFADPARNIGISTTKFRDNQSLVVIDLDTKEDRNGDRTLLQLELSGCEMPDTLEHRTPSGGRHFVFASAVQCRQGTDVLGPGLDIRARGGYILAPGSITKGIPYTRINGHQAPAKAPAWLVELLGEDRTDRDYDAPALAGVDAIRARDRALNYLATAAGAPQGTRGSTAYKVAARLKDFGCTEDEALLLMDLQWNAKCEPSMPDEELAESVAHAYRYGRDPQGSAAPEAIFPAVADTPEPPSGEAVKLHPFAEINKEYAFVKTGAYILQETTDEDGGFITERLTVMEFHAWFANKPWVKAEEKARPISMHWMEWAQRRQYDGVVFSPERDLGPRWYNLWRGFSVAPAPVAQHPALAMFLEHARENVCNGNATLFNWLMGYFAHLVQRPWEKPLVAIVFKGKKGSGKNALIERVGYLLGVHFLVADDERYLLGNFNSHLEANLCFVLDEAAWAGDKKAEGRLKGLITGTKRLIEHKGKEPRSKKSLSRIVVLGNEDWLVPATQDERRFAVFHLGDGRLQDRQFFIDMRVGMEKGGYAHLLRYLLDFDLSTMDVDAAPNTLALTEQKIASLEPLPQWWYDCLILGQIAGGDWAGEWPKVISSGRLRDAYYRWARGRNIRSRLENEDSFGRAFKKLAPSFIKKRRGGKLEMGDTSYGYINPGLNALRADWCAYIGGEIEWPE